MQAQKNREEALPAVQEPVLIERPNMLKHKVGVNGLDARLVGVADHAVAQIANNFPVWLEDTINQLFEARAALSGQSIKPQNLQSLYRCALEAKSMGATYGYPLISRFSHSLCRLLHNLKDTHDLADVLVDAHINAIRAIHRQDIRDADDKMGALLASELERKVQAHLDSLSAK